MEYMKMYKCQILFLFAERLGNALLDGFIFSASPPARFHSISPRRTSFLPHPSPPGGTEGLHCWYSRSHRWAALLWWKSECVESLVELHCMYCIYGIKIVFCSSPVSVPSLLCPPVVKHRCCRQPCKTIWWTLELEKKPNTLVYLQIQMATISSVSDPLLAAFFQASKL